MANFGSAFGSDFCLILSSHHLLCHGGKWLKFVSGWSCLTLASSSDASWENSWYKHFDGLWQKHEHLTQTPAFNGVCFSRGICINKWFQDWLVTYGATGHRNLHSTSHQPPQKTDRQTDSFMNTQTGENGSWLEQLGDNRCGLTKQWVLDKPRSDLFLEG